MKSEDVKKGLECCENMENLMACQECPYHRNHETDGCVHKLIQNALALLHENDAEIERLRIEISMYAHSVEKIAENYHRQGRAEAINEFAERLKKFYSNLKCKTVGGLVKYHIEQIAKEMKGEWK